MRTRMHVGRWKEVEPNRRAWPLRSCENAIAAVFIGVLKGNSVRGSFSSTRGSVVYRLFFVFDGLWRWWEKEPCVGWRGGGHAVRIDRTYVQLAVRAGSALRCPA